MNINLEWAWLLIFLLFTPLHGCSGGDSLADAYYFHLTGHEWKAPPEKTP